MSVPSVTGIYIAENIPVSGQFLSSSDGTKGAVCCQLLYLSSPETTTSFASFPTSFVFKRRFTQGSINFSSIHHFRAVLIRHFGLLPEDMSDLSNSGRPFLNHLNPYMDQQESPTNETIASPIERVDSYISSFLGDGHVEKGSILDWVEDAWHSKAEHSGHDDLYPTIASSDVYFSPLIASKEVNSPEEVALFDFTAFPLRTVNQLQSGSQPCTPQHPNSETVGKAQPLSELSKISTNKPSLNLPKFNSFDMYSASCNDVASTYNFDLSAAEDHCPLQTSHQNNDQPYSSTGIMGRLYCNIWDTPRQQPSSPSQAATSSKCRNDSQGAGYNLNAYLQSQIIVSLPSNDPFHNYLEQRDSLRGQHFAGKTTSSRDLPHRVEQRSTWSSETSGDPGYDMEISTTLSDAQLPRRWALDHLSAPINEHHLMIPASSQSHNTDDVLTGLSYVSDPVLFENRISQCPTFDMNDDIRGASAPPFTTRPLPILSPVIQQQRMSLDQLSRASSPFLPPSYPRSLSLPRIRTSRYRIPNSATTPPLGRSSVPAKTGGFVNFTPHDSRKLLSGVAPSGSSKTRAKRDKEAAEKKKKLSRAAMKAVLAAGGDPSKLMGWDM